MRINHLRNLAFWCSPQLAKQWCRSRPLCPLVFLFIFSFKRFERHFWHLFLAWITYLTSLTALQFSTCHCIFKCSTSINRFSKIDYRSELGVKGLNVPVYTHGREWCLHPRQIFASSVQLLWKFDGTCFDELHWWFDLSRKHKMLRSFSRSFFTFQHREVWSTKFQLVRDVQKKLAAIHRLNRSPRMATFW